MSGWVLVGALCAVALSALAQLALKLGADAVAWTGGVLATARLMATQPMVLGGVMIYGVSVAIWVWVLSRTELSVAYPFAAVSFVMTAALGWLVLGETLSAQRLLGLALIVAGCLVVARSA